MKKGKIFGKKQIVLATMVLALGAAVWLNMKYSASGSILSTSNTSSKNYLGEATYVNGSVDGETEETAAKPQDTSSISSAKKERNETREDAIEELEEIVKDAKSKDSVKTAAVEKLAVLTGRMESEASIEALLKAKGFSEVLAVIGDSDINIIIKTDSLTESQTMQISDIATSQTGLSLDKVKIITVK